MRILTAGLIIIAFELCGVSCKAVNTPSKPNSPHVYTEKLSTPDLTQTDPNGRLPKNGISYCAPVSVSNSFMWLAENGFDNLAPKIADQNKAQFEIARTLGTKPYMNADNGTGMFGIYRGVSRYLKQKGYKYSYFKCQTWRNHPPQFGTKVTVPKLTWIKKGLRGNSAVWLNVGWYKYDPSTDEYRRTGGHWVTLVGSGVDENGKENPNILIIHDPASRAGIKFAHEYVKLLPIRKGRLTGKQLPRPRSAKGYYKLTGGMHIKKSADFAILDGAVVLKMKKPTKLPRLSLPAQPSNLKDI